jgi:O-antigen/teichoic acid export membrane protein
MSINNYLTSARLITLQRVVQAGTGLITALIVTMYLSPEEQGYFYTMASILSAYTLLDLGLSNLLVQISAKHFTKLKWSEDREISPNDNNRVRFLSFVNQSFRWYLYTGFLTLLLIPIGFIYFRYAHTIPTLNWQAPWTFIVLCLALCMPIIGIMSILEGSHRIIEVYTLRIVHYSLGACLAWLMLFSGYGLFALAMPPLAIFGVLTYWLTKNYHHLTKEIFNAERLFDWKKEVGSLHKRVATTWIGNYLFLHVPTPIIFYFLGPEKAGQFGLSMTIANVLAAIATSQITSIVPKYTHLVEEQDFKGAENLFMKYLMVSIKYSIGGVFLFTLFTYSMANSPHLNRLLPWNELLILLLALAAFHGTSIMASYFRAYGKEPTAKFNLYGILFALFIMSYLTSEELFFHAIFILLLCSSMLLIVSIFLAKVR